MLLAKNRKIYYDFSIIEKYLAGIQLRGYEVKAIREGKVSFEGAFVDSVDGELFIKNLYIGKYSKQSGDISEDQAKRNRKLLLNQSEIDEITREIKQKGKTAVPLALLLRNNLIKLEIAVVKGRKDFERKQYVKEKQQKRDLEKESRSYKLDSQSKTRM